MAHERLIVGSLRKESLQTSQLRNEFFKLKPETGFRRKLFYAPVDFTLKMISARGCAVSTEAAA